MSNEYEVDDDGFYSCSLCEWTGKKSGYYKHKKTKHTEGSASHHVSDFEEDAPYEDDTTAESSSYVDTDDIESSEWLNWDSLESEEESTHSMPSPLKAIKKKSTKGKRSKRSAKELQSARSTSKNLITMGLGFSDILMSAWGKGVLLDKDFEVQHKQSDKELVAESGVAYMEEKGIFLSDRISKGVVFASMMGWYHLVPLNDIRKKAEKPFFKRGGGLLSKIPLIGRLFKKKTPKQEVVIHGQE